MSAVYRVVRSINYNLVFIIVAAIAVMYILTSPFISDPILNFCFAGVVPGTNRVLEPDTMLLADGIILAALVLCIGGVMLIRSHRVHKLLAAGMQAGAMLNVPKLEIRPIAAPPAAPKLQLPDSVIRAGNVISHTAGRAKAAAARYPLADRFVAVAIPVLNVVSRILVHIQETISWLLAAYFHITALIVFRLAATVIVVGKLVGICVFRVSRHGIRAAADFAYRASLVADTWLELRLRELSSWGRRLINRYEPLEIFVLIAAEAASRRKRKKPSAMVRVNLNSRQMQPGINSDQQTEDQ